MRHAVIEARGLEPGADLVRAFLVAMLELIEAGWTVGDFSSSAALVCCSRGTEQRMLTIAHVDPHQSHAAPAWQGQRVG
jgi:hypothetical protein